MTEQVSGLFLYKTCSEFPFVIEIYGFPQCLKTRDILQEFQSYRRSEFCVKWVDNTHAIGIFASDRQGQAHDYHNYVVCILYCMGFSVARMWLPSLPHCSVAGSWGSVRTVQDQNGQGRHRGISGDGREARW